MSVHIALAELEGCQTMMSGLPHADNDIHAWCTDKAAGAPGRCLPLQTNIFDPFRVIRRHRCWWLKNTSENEALHLITTALHRSVGWCVLEKKRKFRTSRNILDISLLQTIAEPWDQDKGSRVTTEPWTLLFGEAFSLFIFFNPCLDLQIYGVASVGMVTIPCKEALLSLEFYQVCIGKSGLIWFALFGSTVSVPGGKTAEWLGCQKHVS